MKLERIKRRSSGDLILEITPLIDVVFLLLIFFMVATTFDASTALRINLPKTVIKKRLDSVKEIQILIDRDKNVYLNYKENLISKKQKVDLNELINTVSDKIKNSYKKEVIISGDKNVDYGYVVEIMGILKQAGAEAINIDMAIKR